MKYGYIRVGAVTPKLYLCEPERNAAAAAEAARNAAKKGVKILVFPELCLVGYTLSDLFFQSALLRGAENALSAYIEETKDLDLLSFIGLPVEQNGKLYNAAAAVCGGELLGVVPKSHIPNYNEFYELRHFAPAPSENGRITLAGHTVPFGTNLLFSCPDMKYLTVAAEICEDLWVSVPPSCRHTAAGATVVVNLSASDELVGKPEYRKNLVSMQSARTMSAYLYADAGDGESGTDMVFSAHNLIAENGRILAEKKPFAADELITAEIDLERLIAERRRTNTFRTDTKGDYTVIPFRLTVTDTEISCPPAKTPFVPQDADGRRERCELILTIQAKGLAGRIRRAYAQCAVVGLSGGLDSTLAVLVAARAADMIGFDRKKIIAVTMPGFGTTARTKGNAEKLAEALGVTLRTVSIHAAVEQHFRDISHDPTNLNVVYENAQARERTQILMDMANAGNGIVIGTGDLSELALGFATYNGDHMSMYAVNAGVPKTLVRHIVSFSADCAQSDGNATLAAVLRDILATPVSPELLPPQDGEIAQKTEGIVGPYELHDYFLYHMVRFGYSPKKLFRMACRSFEDDYTPAVILGWLRLFVRRFFSQQFKRSCLPDGPKVGSVVLSPRADWRMPSDASSALFMKELDEIVL